MVIEFDFERAIELKSRQNSIIRQQKSKTFNWILYSISIISIDMVIGMYLT